MARPLRHRQTKGAETDTPGLTFTAPHSYSTVKTIACGNAGRSGVLVVTRVRSTNTKCTRGRGCSGHPAFPTPSKGARAKRTTRAHRAARAESYVERSEATRLRHSGMVRRTRCAIAHRGISRFRVRCFASPRNDGYGFTRCLKIESGLCPSRTPSKSPAYVSRRRPRRLPAPRRIEADP